MTHLGTSSSAKSLIAGFAKFEAKVTQRPARDIAAEVCLRRCVTLDELQGPSRLRRIAWPRQELMYRLRESGKSLTWIGNFLGGRDHTTIYHGANAHRNRMARQ